MRDPAVRHPETARALIAALLPIMTVVFVSYLVIGLAMPVLPLYVHEGLGFGTFMVGLASGCEFAAALVSRFWSGSYADTRGAKRAILAGLLFGTAAGLLYLVSMHSTQKPNVAISILLLGRVLLGASESFVITGALAWGLVLGGPQNTGLVISWIGTALWGAYAIGAPLGTSLYAHYGFTGIALVTALFPALTLLVVVPLRQIAPSAKASPPISRVLGAVWASGIGLALTAVGFGVVTTFTTLLFAQRGWDMAWLAYTTLSAGFILGRLVFGHLPDKLGGARVALVCVLVEAAGLVPIWLAPSPLWAFWGAGITGLGYSLVYPGFGLEAVRRAPTDSRGLAMGAYTAFLDLALGIANPALGLLAAWVGLASVFPVSALVVLCAAGIAVGLLHASAARSPDSTNLQG
jgi:MFS family permease